MALLRRRARCREKSLRRGYFQTEKAAEVDDTEHSAVAQTVERGFQPYFDVMVFAGPHGLRRGYFQTTKAAGGYSAAFIWKPSSILSAGITG